MIRVHQNKSKKIQTQCSMFYRHNVSTDTVFLQTQSFYRYNVSINTMFHVLQTQCFYKHNVSTDTMFHVLQTQCFYNHNVSCSTDTMFLQTQCFIFYRQSLTAKNMIDSIDWKANIKTQPTRSILGISRKLEIGGTACYIFHQNTYLRVLFCISNVFHLCDLHLSIFKYFSVDSIKCKFKN